MSNHASLAVGLMSVGLLAACLPKLLSPTDDYLNQELQLVTESTSDTSNSFYFLLQPSDCTTVNEGTAIFSCMTNANDVSYRWQSYTPSSGAWNDSVINDSAYSPTLSFTAYTFRNGYMYRCLATNNQTGQRIVSNTATLWVETDSKSPLPIYDPIHDSENLRGVKDEQEKKIS